MQLDLELGFLTLVVGLFSLCTGNRFCLQFLKQGHSLLDYWTFFVAPLPPLLSGSKSGKQSNIVLWEMLVVAKTWISKNLLPLLVQYPCIFSQELLGFWMSGCDSLQLCDALLPVMSLILLLALIISDAPE